MGQPFAVFIYQGTALANSEVQELVTFLGNQVDQLPVVREEFVRYWIRRRDQPPEELRAVASKLAMARVCHPEKDYLDRVPLPGEIDFELKYLFEEERKPPGIVYDGFHLAKIFSGLMGYRDPDLETCHIVLTDQLIGTQERHKARYHIRVAVFGYPSIISTAGIVEGPARPREYYLGRRFGIEEGRLQKVFDERFIKYGDPRLREVIKGYMLQALFYHLAGNPFCENKECPLFNAHWQEDMIHAQLKGGSGLCAFHREILNQEIQ